MRLILASSSPRRRALIASLGQPFDIVKPDIDEDIRRGEPPLDYVSRLSREKAAAVLDHLSTKGQRKAGEVVVLAADTIVLSADTIGVEQDGGLLGKPRDVDEAWDMLKRLRDQPHEVYTAFTLHRSGDEHPFWTERVRTLVTMRPYSDEEIAAYIATGDPFDKAGGYAIQHAGFHPVARIDGCYNNVVGLPLCRVKTALASVDWGGVAAPGGCDCEPFDLG
jgi:septum formation protein